MSAVVLLVELKIAEGKRDAFVARGRQHRERVLREESDCERFDIVVPEGTSDIVRLYEVYADQAAVDHHMQTDYMAAYRADTADMVVDREIVKATMAND